MNIDRKMVQYIKSVYKKGERVICYGMQDPYAPIQYGMMGTVTLVDDIGTIHVRWDNGRTLGIIYGVDNFAKI